MLTDADSLLCYLQQGVHCLQGQRLAVDVFNYTQGKLQADLEIDYGLVIA